jgi:cell division transport system permease protein
MKALKLETMRLYIKKALVDILDNRFLNTVTILTIAFSILIVSSFSLFVMNTNTLLESWKKSIRVMVYLKPSTAPQAFKSLETRIKSMDGIESVLFIPRSEALRQLKAQMQRHASLLDRLERNPLPDAFEIRVAADSRNLENVEKLARQLERLVAVEEVEYGQKWLGRFTHMIKLFSLAGYLLGGMFLMAAIFFVGNTVRLVIYSRRDEIEIMRLVGAEAGFIKAPFYIQGLIQGLLGGVLGLAGLLAVFLAVSSQVQQGFGTGVFEMQFLPPAAYAGIILASMLVGWLGCFLSLKQYLKP